MTSCRLAFHGTILQALPNGEADLPLVRIYRPKVRTGRVARKLSDTEVIGDGMFDRHTDLAKFLRLRVHTRSGWVGEITGKFGNSGKFRVQFSSAPPPADLATGTTLELRSKRFLYRKFDRLQQ
jgi:eEFSec C-terminal RIFT domain